MENKHISCSTNHFYKRIPPEEGTIVGYAAIIESLQLALPIPHKIALISTRHRRYEKDNWLVFTPRHQPKESIYHHIIFALKYEGVNLLFFKKLFAQVPKETIENWVIGEPQSRYARKIWFLYEWLLQEALNIADLKEGNYISLVDESLQYACSPAYNSGRHRIKNNLPGNVHFCPLISKTATLDKFINDNLNTKTNKFIQSVNEDLLSRTSAFLLVKDSKASFTIEGEIPTQNRALRWGSAIQQAGLTPLDKEELLRLQQIVIEKSRFIKLGYRTEGGFIGEHDRITGEPIPDHISARWQDIDTLMSGLLEAAKLMEENKYHPVLTAASIAFGFVFIHPFEDGNGRLHRYLIHYLLAIMKFSPQGIIFPVSAAILEKIVDYRKVLEDYSHTILDFILWKKTEANNIEVLNDTKDYYSYFNATLQAEFLFESIEYTINHTIPDELDYLQKYDRFKAWIDKHFKMPEKKVALLIQFLNNNKGSLSKRARNNEFSALEPKEAMEIERFYQDLFISPITL
jgi:Fic family protein